MQKLPIADFLDLRDVHNLLLADAFPEWDLRYFSKARAVDLSLKAR
jgi:hypothetical protein